MPEINDVPGSPEEWLDRAQSDLSLAGIAPPAGVQREDLCFHAQQAAEKALKAIFKYYQWSFAYTHDLDLLIAGLEEHHVEIPSQVKSAVILTSYAWQTRYPGVSEPVTEVEHRDAVRLAREVVRWAHEEMGLAFP